MSNVRTIIKDNKWPLIIGLVAVLVRLVYLLELDRWPEFAVPMVDEKWHWEWARDIASKSFWGEGAYFRAPLYPYFLAAVATVTGYSVFWAKLLQSLLCFGTAIFIYRLAERLFGRTTAVVSGFMYALYGVLVFYETMFLIPVLFLFFVTWGMYRYVAHFESASLKSWLLTGVLFGLAAICRPNILLVIPFLMLWKYFRVEGRLLRPARFAAPLVLLAGLVLPILPVTARNLIVTGDFILISSQGGINLYLGNNPSADGLTMLMPEVDLDESISWRQFGTVTSATAQRLAGRALSESEVSSFWSDRAVDFILDNPSQFLGLVWKKCVYLVDGFENSDNINIYRHRDRSLLYSLLVWHRGIFFPFGLLLPLAFMGVYLCRRESLRLAPLYVYLIAYTPSIVLFLVTARHRLSMIPFLIIIAAAGLVKLRQILAPRIDKRQLLIGGAILIAPLILLNRTYYGLGLTGMFQIHFNAGIALERLSDYAGAEREYRLADAEFPYSAPLIDNLAHVQFRLGRRDDAEKNYRRAIGVDPDYANAYNNYGLLMQQSGRLDSALALYSTALAKMSPETTDPDAVAQTMVNVAEARERLGDTLTAAAMLDTAVERSVRSANVLFKAAAFYARHGEAARGDSLFDAGLQRGEGSAADWFNSGLSHLRRGQIETGVERMHRAVALDSALYQAYFTLAAAHRDTGSPRDSVDKYLDLCLKYNARYAPAVRLRDEMK